MSDSGEKNASAFKGPDFEAVARGRATSYQRTGKIMPGMSK